MRRTVALGADPWWARSIMYQIYSRSFMLSPDLDRSGERIADALELRSDDGVILRVPSRATGR